MSRSETKGHIYIVTMEGGASHAAGNGKVCAEQPPPPPYDATPTEAGVAELRRLHRRGLTPLDVSRIYGVPLRTVFREYVWADLYGRAPIGKPDEWSVWHAHPSDVKARFGARPAEQAITQSVAAKRAADRADVLRAILGEDAE